MKTQKIQIKLKLYHSNKSKIYFYQEMVQNKRQKQVFKKIGIYVFSYKLIQEYLTYYVRQKNNEICGCQDSDL